MSEIPSVDMSFCDTCEHYGTVIDDIMCPKESADWQTNIAKEITRLQGNVQAGEPTPVTVINLVNDKSEDPVGFIESRAAAQLPKIAACIEYVQEHGHRPQYES